MGDKTSEYVRHAAAALGMPCSRLELDSPGMPGGEFCAQCLHTPCGPAGAHLYGCHEAWRWNGQFIYYCPLGLVFAAATLSEDGALTGALIAGPCVMGDMDDTLDLLPCREMESAVRALAAYSAADVGHRAALLTAVARFCSHGPGSSSEAIAREQEKLLGGMYSDIGDEKTGEELIDFEKQLRALVTAGDKPGAQKLLNELLGKIYFYSNFDFETIRARAIELVVVLSRATIDAGADVGAVFVLNASSLRGIVTLTGLEELSVRLSAVMHRFISCAFDVPAVRGSDTVHRIMRYVRTHLSEKITLEDLAREIFLSRTYISGVFKAQTGLSLSSYIMSARVSKAKRLLRESRMSLSDVAAGCGFEDQSYFTRIFTRETGTSPKKYRDANRPGR